MPHGGGMLRLLVLCLHLPLVYGKAGGGEIAKPGDKDYWVLLGSIYTLQGSFEKPFSPSGEDFTVNVNDIHLKKHELHFQIDAGKYVEGGFPAIYVDGTKIEDFNLNGANTVTTDLDDGIDGVEKTVEIRVADPKQVAGVFLKHREHVYRVVIKQPPEYNLVVQAENINLTDVDGRQILPDSPFVATSAQSSYKYSLAEGGKCKDDSCIVQLRLRCPSVATTARIDSHNVGNDEAYNIDMSNEISKRVSAVCRYENPYWTRLPRMRYYEIVLERNVTFQGDVLVHMPSFEGVCDKVLIDGAKSFECRTRVDEPKVTFYSSQHQASLYLLDNEAGTTLRMQNGIPMPIKLPEDADNYQFKLQFGHDEHIYPLRLYMPPMCNKSNLECPEGQGPKEESMSAIEHMCHSTECSTEVDAPLCCGDRDSCDHYTGGCKRHTTLRFDAADTLCEITVCHDWDQDTCCAALARCDTYSPSGCHVHEALRHDSRDIECARDVCDLTVDHDTCCRPKAMCDTYDFPCPDGQALSLKASRLECLLDVCTKDDYGACCAPKARCDTFPGTCPEHKTLRHDAADVMCNACGCEQDDDKVCCRSISNCASYNDSCPAGMAVRLDAAEVPCALDVCTEEADQEACCQATCGRFDPAMCPGNEVVRHDGDYICNNGLGDKCSAHECCHLRARCSTFEFDCPIGTIRRHDALNVECATDVCRQEDEDVCCRPRQTCSEMPTHACPRHMVPGHAQRNELCVTDRCGTHMSDKRLCCTGAASCAEFVNFTCPPPRVIKTNLESLDCAGEFCAQEDQDSCCGHVAHCMTLDCLDRAPREEPNATCMAFECTEQDLEQCCVERPNCSEFNFSCAQGTSLAYRAAERKCRGSVCHPDDTSLCCVARASCRMFQGSCPEGSSIYAQGLCQQEKCTDEDMELCCIVEQAVLEGLARVSNIDFERLANKSLTFRLAEAVCDKLVVEGLECEGTVAADRLGGSVQVMFDIDVSGADQPIIAVQKERLKNKDAIAFALNAAIAYTEMWDCKNVSEDPLGIPFLAVAEGQVDLTHGGIYYPAILGARDEDDQWTVQLAWGETLTGVSPDALHHFDKSDSDDYSEGDRVRVLVALAKAAMWEERGISRELAFRIAEDQAKARVPWSRLPAHAYAILAVSAAALAMLWWAGGFLVFELTSRSPPTASSAALLADDAAEEPARPGAETTPRQTARLDEETPQHPGGPRAAAPQLGAPDGGGAAAPPRGPAGGPAGGGGLPRPSGDEGSPPPSEASGSEAASAAQAPRASGWRQRVARTFCPGGARRPRLGSARGPARSDPSAPPTASSDARSDVATMDTSVPPAGPPQASPEQAVAVDADQE